MNVAVNKTPAELAYGGMLLPHRDGGLALDQSARPDRPALSAAPTLSLRRRTSSAC